MVGQANSDYSWWNDPSSAGVEVRILVLTDSIFLT